MIEKLTHAEPLIRTDLIDYKNPKLSDDDRVADLIARMTLEEKVAQMMCIWGQKKTILFDEAGKLNLKQLKVHLKDGIGQVGRISDTAGGLDAKEMTEFSNSLQKYFVEETRLGIPAIFHEECLHGLAAKDATSYPQPIGLASTFDPRLIEEIYTAIAEETRTRGAHQALTPVVDVARDPRWGRVEETFGEDPYLVSQMGIAAVRGFQGDRTFKDKKRVIATLKHFAAHGQPESGSNCGPANFSERVLRDVFLFPFKEVLSNGKALSVMASYNEIDGVPSHANRWLLRDVLRGEWGFEGYVVSDYYAITEMKGKEDSVSHAVAADKVEAAILAINAGVNIELPDPDCYPNIVKLVQDGVIVESAIDELVAALLKYKFQLGLFDDPYLNADPAQHDRRIEENRKIALRAAHETITLLKNKDGLLPLNVKKGGTIAVIGPNANRKMLGGYSGKPRYYTSVLQGIQEKAGKNFTILYSEGCKNTVGGSWEEDAVTLPDPAENRALIAEAVATAAKADTIILAIGDNEQTSREAWSKVHLGDRASLELFGMQNELVEAMVATGKPIVVVLFNGRPNSIPYIEEHVPAVVECWYLGQETGTAVADVLFGDFNPGGKLPISIPRSAGHIPCFYNHKPSARRGYLFDEISALYPFGYGLSYSSFSFSNVRLEKPIIRVDESTQVFVDVKNTSGRAGDEVVQLYIRDVASSVTRPVKELKGFKRINLKPGETQTVAFVVSPDHLSFTNIDKEYLVEAGDFEIMVGNSSRSQDLSKVILRVI
ncbi:MAG TPA: glycoside hydrolase family 3 N-terminal domain-containing protein [Bacteroidota bacterium]|nr:glycoside hydrolase family 3 N-terminal domain-containing protein [Bacteroidota bacterium]